MSHQSTLSPSPAAVNSGIRSRLASFFTRSNASDSSSSNSNSERRRLSHPHNPSQSSSQPRRPENMPERHQSQRPRLEHQASRTVTTIDLTDEPEEEVAAPRGRARRPPQLGRSDAQGLSNVIDLTDVADDDHEEIVITATRQVQPGRPRANANPHSRSTMPDPPRLNAQAFRDDSPGLFVPLGPIHGPPLERENRHAQRVFDAGGPIAGGGGFERHHPGAGGHANAFFDHQAQAMRAQLMHAQMRIHAHAQALPIIMDYGRHAFDPPPVRRPDHVPPPPARDGYTRSTKETDVIVCPSCEEELIHDKAAELEPAVKKGGKAPSRKEMEEHPFWALKDCGHVNKLALLTLPLLLTVFV